MRPRPFLTAPSGRTYTRVPVSQVLLGFRNLSVRIAIFVALAALLVWFLGGSLFPRAEGIVRGAVEVGRAGEGLATVRLVEIVHPIASLPSERVTWMLEIAEPRLVGSRFEPCSDVPLLVDAGSLTSVSDPTGFRTAYFVGRKAGADPCSDCWCVFAIGGYERSPREVHAYPDRLEAERQIARIAMGLPAQDPAAAAAAREAMLRAGDPATGG